MPADEDRIVFFVHVMKTGGSTALRQLMTYYPKLQRYPLPGVLGAIEEKSLISSFTGLDHERRERLRWIAPHMPLSVALSFRAEQQRPVSTTLVLRDGLERALSHLKQISRRFEHRYSYRELLDLPFIGNFFICNHQTRVLGTGVDGWPLWDECFRALTELPRAFNEPGAGPAVAPVDEVLLQQAIANLSQVDVLGLQDGFGAWWQACRESFGWPQEPSFSVNVGAEQDRTPPPPIPDTIIEELRARNALDIQLVAAAKVQIAA